MANFINESNLIDDLNTLDSDLDIGEDGIDYQSDSDAGFLSDIEA